MKRATEMLEQEINMLQERIEQAQGLLDTIGELDDVDALEMAKDFCTYWNPE